jgi:hypothetical protein
MIAINTIPSQDAQLPEWREKGKYTFPVALSSSSNFARTNYGVSGTPTNLLLNADRKLVFRLLGYGTGGEKTMEAEIRELLGLKPFEGIEPPKATTAPAVEKK